MNQWMTVLQIITPIFVAVGLGILAKRKDMISAEQMQGLQQFVMKFGLPCVVFNSCYGAKISAEAVTSMALVVPLVLLSSVWAFRSREKWGGYHNFPMLFSAKETGMLGIPLFMTLFGVEQAYRVGVLDLAQSVIAIPCIAILAADAGKNPTVGEITKKVVKSSLLIMSVLGLVLNLSGAAAWMNGVGIGGIITETTGFLSQPVSAAMLFSVGYNFSMGKDSRGEIFRMAAIHFAMFAVFCGIMQGVLLLLGEVDAETRWAVLLYCMLPCSYLSPSLGRSEEEYTISSGVCSILTVVSLAIFCVMAAIVT